MRLNIVSNPKMTTTKDKVASAAAVAEQIVLVRDSAIVHPPQVALVGISVAGRVSSSMPRHSAQRARLFSKSYRSISPIRS